MRNNGFGWLIVLVLFVVLMFGGSAMAGPFGLFGGGKCCKSCQPTACSQSVQTAPTVTYSQPQYTPVRTVAGGVIYNVGTTIQSVGQVVGGTCSRGSCSSGPQYGRGR